MYLELFLPTFRLILLILAADEIKVSSPNITEPPRQSYLPLGSPVNLTCFATGVPQPTLSWFKDDVPISNAIASVLFIERLSLETRGVYKCVASNVHGKDEAEAFVKVDGNISSILFLTSLPSFVSFSFRPCPVLSDVQSQLRACCHVWLRWSQYFI